MIYVALNCAIAKWMVLYVWFQQLYLNMMFACKRVAFDIKRLFYAPLMHEERRQLKFVHSFYIYVYFFTMRDLCIFCCCIYSKFDTIPSSAFFVIEVLRFHVN